MTCHCTGIVVALRVAMAIMWDPPDNTRSFDPTPAEIAWRMWLMQAVASSAAEEARLREALVRDEGTAEDSPKAESQPVVES